MAECDICGKRAQVQKVLGYEPFMMCPHCAYMTIQHSKKLQKKNFDYSGRA